MGSFLYPRVVSVSRPTVQSSAGAQAYGGVSPVNETPIAANLPANIQLQKAIGGAEAGLPADTSKARSWVFIPARAAANGLIAARDIVTDDLGVRYQVVYPGWNSLGHRLLAERLEA